MADCELETCDVGSVPRFSFAGRRLQARIADVYDGDTVTAIFAAHEGGLYKMAIRLHGVDTPERRGASAGEREAAAAARAFVARWALPGRWDAGAVASTLDVRASLGREAALVELRCLGFDKYGRCLATVWRGGDCLNDRLLEEGHAVPYDGGRRKPWADRAGP